MRFKISRLLTKNKTVIIAALFFLLGNLTMYYGKLIQSYISGLFAPPGTSTATATATADTEADPYPVPPAIEGLDTHGIAVYSRAVGGYFYVNKSGGWKPVFIKGVNIGLTLPTTDLNNPDIPYETYYRWFEHISSMNANTVRVFTIMNPDFYSAFYDFNVTNPQKPLYLLQGIWINENDMHEIGDAYGAKNKILNAFKRTAREMLDIVHGNSDYTSYGNIEKAIYDKDVSRYVIGFILGLEWMPEFILTTNGNNKEKSEYSGEYLYTENATPFEAFLCNVGNELIEYQTEHYATQTPVAFLNWQTTDVLTHPNEPFPEEDAVSLNTNSIRSTGKYYPGLFAAVDIYPYYPEFMNHQKNYTEYIDPSGKPNPYRAYLKDLIKEYPVPVLVAEFGVPTSRGKAHVSSMGYDQGGITEKEQGEMALSMMRDIAKEGYAGGVLFSWQDEWFKQTWNTVKYYAANPYTRTQNPQSAEQHYGILAFDISGGQRFIPDGDAREWEGTEGIRQGNIEWKAALKEDALFIYINWREASFDPETDTLAIAVGTTGRGSTADVSRGLAFSGGADFLVLINGKDNTRVLTDAYYDTFYYQYSVVRKVFPADSGNEKQNGGIYNPIRQFLSNEIVLPIDKVTIPPLYYESGLLRYGNANPESEDYDSLADFYYTRDFAEIRIPWVLLNVMNFPEKRRLADFHKQKAILTEDLDFVSIGVAQKAGSGQTYIQMHEMELPDYDEVLFTERLKQSYRILAHGLPGIMQAE